MKIVIPEYKTLEVDRLFLDFNGTIAVDGIIPAGVRQRLEQLAAEFTIYVLTADTNGNAKEQCQGLPVILQTFPTGNARDYKKELVKATGSRCCVAVGNGRNDELMLREAALSNAVRRLVSLKTAETVPEWRRHPVRIQRAASRIWSEWFLIILYVF